MTIDFSKIDENDDAAIYDFETLSSKPETGVVVSFSVLNYDESRFIDKPYEYMELVEAASFIKFDVKEQIHTYGRKIQKDTLDWWGKQNEAAREQIKPSSDDKSIDDLHGHFIKNVDRDNLKTVYSRRNTFDPVFFSNLMEVTGHELPYAWWIVRDTVSLIDGLTWGHEIKDSFMPSEDCKKNFVHHRPDHDIALDVMRMQTLIQAL